MTSELPHTDQTPQPTTPAGKGHGGHRMMMIVCCIPMLVIVGVLVATGVAGSGFILYAVACIAMMAMMMRMMPGDRGR